LLAYVQENDRASAVGSSPEFQKPVRQLSPTFVNQGRVLVNP
jgi:hypothetical protein